MDLTPSQEIRNKFKKSLDREARQGKEDKWNLQRLNKKLLQQMNLMY